ncbi:MULTISPECIES: hypothetical protein [unclassified Sphingomonas]|uniref:hypothetical protein n=1 Tax=unclassified Sphingomonas TaxID=196159 RepID=UPI000B1B7391|nr:MULTISPECIES: hypothetical protein [unclassified Sphingomonas]
METRFSVAAADVDAAIAWLGERGFAPCRVEYGDGDAALVFPLLPGDRLGALAMALPLHLSSKVGIVVGDGPPFSAGR